MHTDTEASCSRLHVQPATTVLHHDARFGDNDEMSTIKCQPRGSRILLPSLLRFLDVRRQSDRNIQENGGARVRVHPWELVTRILRIARYNLTESSNIFGDSRTIRVSLGKNAQRIESMGYSIFVDASYMRNSNLKARRACKH